MPGVPVTGQEENFICLCLLEHVEVIISTISYQFKQVYPCINQSDAEKLKIYAWYFQIQAIK